MSTFPHMFEIANAKQLLHTLNRDGTPAILRSTSDDVDTVDHITLNGFQVKMDDYYAYIQTRTLSFSLVPFFTQFP